MDVLDVFSAHTLLSMFRDVWPLFIVAAIVISISQVMKTAMLRAGQRAAIMLGHAEALETGEKSYVRLRVTAPCSQCGRSMRSGLADGADLLCGRCAVRETEKAVEGFTRGRRGGTRQSKESFAIARRDLARAKRLRRRQS